MELQTVKKKRYKILEKSENVEVRQYFPVKRSIIVSGRSYFLAFPYIVFAKVRKKYNRGQGEMETTHLGVAFTNRELYPGERDAVLFHPPFPNVEDVSSMICLDRNAQAVNKHYYGHYHQVPDIPFSQLLEKFWTNSFGPVKPWQVSDLALHLFYGGRYGSWTKMSPEKVLEVLDVEKTKDCGDWIKPYVAFPLHDFVERLKRI